MARGTDRTRPALLGAAALLVAACSSTTTQPPPQTGGGSTPSAASSRPGSTLPASTAPISTAAPAPSPPAQPAPAPSPAAVPTGCPVPAGLAGQDVERVGGDAKVIALTFDGGADAEGVEKILAVVDREQVPVTFFVTGDFAERHPDRTRALAARGPVGNHTQTHPDLTKVGAEQGAGELDRAARSIRAVTGRDTVPYFRFPFGARNASTIAMVNDHCYVPFRWTTDSLGWKGTSGGMSAQKVQDRVLADLEPGGIVLMHLGSHPTDGSTLDADALPGIISGARAQGYSFVGLDAAFSSS